MALRVLALLMTLGVLQPAWGAVAGVFHTCFGQAQQELECCCTHGESAPGIRAPHGSCCGTLKAADASDPWTRPDLLRDGELSAVTIRLAVAAPPLRSAALAQCGAVALPQWTERAMLRATAPPLFIQHCSFLI